MTATASVTENDALTALRMFITALLDPAVEVVRGQDNRVGEPRSDNYVVMTTMGRVRLSTNIVSYADVPGAGLRSSREAVELTIQLDVHGPASTDNAQILASLLRDGYASEAFAATGLAVRPLYASDPRQMPFINGEDQYEDRWTLDAVLQVNPVVSVPQSFADHLAVHPVSVDSAYPPGRGPVAPPGLSIDPIP